MHGSRRLAVLAALALAAAGAPPRAGAGAPPAGPVFSDPLVLDHPYLGVTPGVCKVFRGTEGRRRITVLEQHLASTRSFAWNGGSVACRQVRESKFEDGALVEMSLSHFARADDGSVWYFGEVSEPLPPVPGDDGDDEPGDTESGSWVVGAPAGGDPPDTTSTPDPFLYFPAAPVPGDSWKPEDIADVVDETDTLLRSGVRLRVAGRRLEECLVVEERSGIDPGAETKWFAPGLGVVRSQGRGSALRLEAGTLLRR